MILNTEIYDVINKWYNLLQVNSLYGILLSQKVRLTIVWSGHPVTVNHFTENVLTNVKLMT